MEQTAFLPLVDKRQYRDGWGNLRTPMGDTADGRWVWTLQGDWYERSTGRYVHTNRGDGKCETFAVNNRNLIEEAKL